MRGTSDGTDKEGVRGDGSDEVISSETGVSLIPTIICAGPRVGCISAPACQEVT